MASANDLHGDPCTNGPKYAGGEQSYGEPCFSSAQSCFPVIHRLVLERYPDRSNAMLPRRSELRLESESRLSKHGTALALYKNLLKLYPQKFRERFAESMQQTFHDLYNEHKRAPAHGFVVLSLFTETAMGIAHEHLLLLIEGDHMKGILANPTSAAIISFILALPLGLIFVVLMFNIQPLANLLFNLFTLEGPLGEMYLNTLGRIVIYGGLLLLPVAFVLNLRPMLVQARPEGKRTFHKVNLILGAAILLLITFTWGALLQEQIYCLQGIRCD